MDTDQLTRRQSERCPVELRPKRPDRRVDWRWRRAEWRLRTKSRRGEREDDASVLRAIRALRWLGRGRSDKDPDVVRAHTLLWPDYWIKAELEARILANQSIRAISATMGISQEVIAVFEAMFFDVRGRLAAQDWVMHSVLGSTIDPAWKPHDVMRAWREIGYLFGPGLLNVLVNGVDRKDLGIIGLPAYWASNSRLPKELQLLLLSRSIPDVGRTFAGPLNQLIELGLCRQRPHYVPPPKDGSLDMGGEYCWVSENDGLRPATHLSVYAADAA